MERADCRLPVRLKYKFEWMSAKERIDDDVGKQCQTLRASRQSQISSCPSSSPLIPLRNDGGQHYRTSECFQIRGQPILTHNLLVDSSCQYDSQCVVHLSDRRWFLNLNIVVHPLVLLSVADHHARAVSRNSQKRVVGVLLGQDNGRTINVANSFGIPFEEDEKDSKTWFLDHNYIQGMYEMFKKVNGA